MGTFRHSLNRRSLLKSAAAVGLAAPGIWTFDRALGADQITFADNGGTLSAACRKAFYDPFEKETGIHVVNVAHDADPVTQWKLMMDSGNHLWDGCMVTPDYVFRLTQDKNYLASLNITPEEASELLPGMATDKLMIFHIFAVVMAYRTDRFGGAAPASWADFFDLKKFPGKRGLYRNVQGTLEMVLLGDGVPLDKLYPIDYARAFRKLDTIKDHIVWWTSGAQNTQLLQSGEVDISDTWNARANAAIESGAPVKMLWNGVWSSDGWSVAAGTPRLDLARKFVKFCMKAEPQKAYVEMTKVGPSNKKTLEMLSPELVAKLPTAPQNIKGLTELDSAYWAKANAEITEKFEEWLLS